MQKNSHLLISYPKGNESDQSLHYFLISATFLKENATVFRWFFILRTERDKRKWGYFLLQTKAAVFRLRQKSEHGNTRCTARLNIKHTSTYQPKCSPIEWVSSLMIKFLSQYQRQCNKWFSSVVVSYSSWHTFILLLIWGGGGGSILHVPNTTRSGQILWCKVLVH